MKYLKYYKIFEDDNYTLDSHLFLEKYLKNVKYTINGISGKIDVYGSVDISKRTIRDELDTIPVTFGNVSGTFNCEKQNLKSFEFLPENCQRYEISGNPGVKGILETIVNKSPESILNKFIKSCLIHDVWYNGNTNEDTMYEVWTQTKLNYYKDKKTKDPYFTFMKFTNEPLSHRNISQFADLITIDDEEILCDYFGISIDANWLSNVVKKLIENIKSEDPKVRLDNFYILCNLVHSDYDDKIKNIMIEYDLESVYNTITRQTNTRSALTYNRVEDLLILTQKKLTRTDVNRSRDVDNDLFVFIAGYEYKEKDNDPGNYKKQLAIENLCKINMYDPESLKAIQFMKMRATVHNAGDRSAVYMIRLPKGIFDVEKDNYYPGEIPKWILELIDKHKEKI